MTHVKRSLRSCYRPTIAGFAVVLYTVILAIGSGCGLVHGDLVHGHHQHHNDQGSSAQDNTCAWICQATADAGATIGPPPTSTNLALGPPEFASVKPVVSTPSSAIQSRAPPSTLFI